MESRLTLTTRWILTTLVAIGVFFLSWWLFAVVGLANDVSLSLAAVAMAACGAPLSAWASNSRRENSVAPPADILVVGDVPPRANGFVCRDSLLGRIRQVDERGPTVFCLVGQSGVGKSQLAAEWAREMSASPVAMVAWILAEAEATIVEGLACVADRVGLETRGLGPREKAARAKKWIEESGNPVALVFDNATGIGALREWLPGLGRARVLVTSTYREVGAAGTEIAVEPFEQAVAADFLRDRTGLTDARGAETVAAELGGLPLAVAQAAAVVRAEGITFREYARRLGTRPADELLPSAEGDGYPRGTAEAIMVTISSVGRDDDAEEAAMGIVLGLLSVLPSTSSGTRLARAVRALSLVSGAGPTISDAMVARCVARAADVCLVTSVDGGRVISMHRLTQRVIRDHLMADGTLGDFRLAAAYEDPDHVQRRTLLLMSGVQVAGGAAVSLGLISGPILSASVGSIALAGLALAVMLAGGALIALPGTWITGKFGRRPGLAFSLLAASAGGLVAVLAAFSEILAVLFVGLALSGSGTAAILAGRYAVVDLSRPHTRGRHLSRVIWCVSIGAIAGALSFSFVERNGQALGMPAYSSAFLVNAAIFGVSALAVWLFMRPDPLILARVEWERAHGQNGGSAPISSGIPPPSMPTIADLLAAARLTVLDRGLRAGFCAVVLAHASMIAAMIFGPLHLLGEHPPHHGVDSIGIAVGLHIAFMYLLAPLVGFAVDHWTPRPVILCGAVLLAGGSGSLAYSTGSGAAIAALGAIGLGWSACMIAGSTLLAAATAPPQKAGVLGLGDLSTSLAGVLAASFAGPVMSGIGFSGLTAVTAALSIPMIWLAAQHRT